MGRDPHRAPGRLAPLRPDYERGTPAQPPPERPPAKPPVRPDTAVPVSKTPDPNYIDERTPELDDATAAEPVYTPSSSSPADTAPGDEAPWAMDDTQPRLRVPRPAQELPPSKPGSLSIQERHELLIHTISLYEDKWRLAGIQANPKTNRLHAYLLPRNKQIDLKEAISKDLALSVTVDPRGSTIVKEPKSRGLFTRIKNWLLGG